MAKKNFKDNPALRFISATIEESESDTHITYNADDEDNTINTHNTDEEHNTTNTHNAYNEHNTVNIYNTDNEYYATNTQNTNNEYNTTNAHNTDNEHNVYYTDIICRDRIIEKRERKTKRLNLLIRPSTFEKMDKIAYIRKTSVNELINRVLEEYVAGRTEDMDKYKRVLEVLE